MTDLTELKDDIDRLSSIRMKVHMYDKCSQRTKCVLQIINHFLVLCVCVCPTLAIILCFVSRIGLGLYCTYTLIVFLYYFIDTDYSK